MEGTPFFTAQGANEVVSEIVEEIVTEGANILYDHYLQERELPYAVSRVLGDVHSVLRLAFLAGDGEAGPGEVVGTPAFFDGGAPSRAPGATIRDTGLWACEDEPVPCAIDTWARQAVPTKKPPPKREVLEDPAVTAAKKSVGSRSRKSSSPRPRGNRPDNPKPAAPLFDRTMSPRLTTTPVPEVTPVSKASVDQATRARALAEYQRREAEREERQRREEAEARAEAEANDRLRKELRGQKVTLDDNGQVMVVKKVAYNRLPPTFDTVSVALESDAHSEVPSQATNPRSRTSRGATRGGRGRGRGRGRAPPQPKPAPLQDYESKDGGEDTPRSEGGEDPFFQESLVIQPPLTDTISLAPGVVLREGPSVIEGPAPPEDSMHMSRRDFTAHQSVLTASVPETVSPRDSPVDVSASRATAYADPSDPDISMTQDPSWGDNSRVLDAEVAPAPPSRRPNAAQKHATMGGKPRGARDRSFVTANSTSRRSANVSATRLPSPTGGAADGLDAPSMESSLLRTDSLSLPAIPSAMLSSASSLPRKKVAEWGDTAARKAAGSVTMTEHAKALLPSVK